jgi:acyl-CoA synthetase (AMP-forming)/AMP-acid ligase II
MFYSIPARGDIVTDMEWNLADLFESLADAIPDRTALVCGATRSSFAELEARANRLAGFLRARGVGHGDHVGLHLHNGAEFVEAMLAALKLRAVPINCNYRYVADELRYLFDNADIAALITQTAFAEVVDDASRGLGTLHTIVWVGDGPAWIDGGLAQARYEEAMAQGSPLRDFGPRSGDDLYIIYTGGTTGMPKGVMWRQEDMFFAGLQGGAPGGEPLARPEQLAANAMDPDNALNLLPAAPFIHGAAQWAAWIGLHSGGKVVIQPGPSFDAHEVCRLVGAESVNTLTLVGDAMALPIVDALAAPGASYNFTTCFAIASAGAVLSASVRQRLQELVPDTMVLNNFGSTEAGHQGSAYPGQETGTDGRPSFAMDATSAVFDDEGRPIEPGSGKVGRIARQGRIPLGYYKDPDKTAERFIELDGARWCLPGDYGTVEQDGRITLYGRGSGCINTGGEKVYPEEVEEVLKAHPHVFDALVVGVADPRWMQRVAAVVQPRGDAALDLEMLQAHCRKHLAGYKLPRQLELVPAIARMPSGKPDYAWARQVATGGSDTAAR